MDKKIHQQAVDEASFAISAILAKLEEETGFIVSRVNLADFEITKTTDVPRRFGRYVMIDMQKTRTDRPVGSLSAFGVLQK